MIDTLECVLKLVFSGLELWLEGNSFNEDTYRIVPYCRHPGI